MKQLERLLFLQGNKCFLCAQPIPEGEASVEHLVATSNGGPKDDENCIVCCKAVNAALGNLSIKSKLQAILNQRAAFTCPSIVSKPVVEPPSIEANSDDRQERLKLIIADLIKRGPSRPRKVATLRNTINSIFQMQLPDEEVDALMSELERQGCITRQDTKVTYALGTKDA